MSRTFEIMTNRLVGFSKTQIVDESEFDGGSVGWLESTGHVRLVESKPTGKPTGNTMPDKEGNNDG